MIAQDMAKSLTELTIAYGEKVQPVWTTNNWLKIHGLPMRRKTSKKDR